MMEDFEKLGVFYLGKRVADADASLTSELVLYESKDLTTHAVIVGMTGSGKTGLGIGLIEEAALDHVPVIAIDPKGDLGNLLLTFPALDPADFLPWIDPRAALEAGVPAAELAARTATTWRQGLAAWGQSLERIAKLREAADFRLFTPGSNAGESLSVLARLAPPPPELIADEEPYRELLDGTAAGLLTLLRLGEDTATSREHVLLTAILDAAWRVGRPLDLPALIGAVQSPPFAKVGVLDLEAFFPASERFGLAMRLNTLVAAPRFKGWLEGAPLEIDRLLYSPTGQPRVSVLSIAHLDDSERMLFVTLLLTKLIAWMRRQSGSGSLRAILYMDEVFGFMPPVANPPSKRALLTLLKQARAYGVGVTLATQNPVDLDYKGLANAGTWFIGRLQTERDKERLVEGLRSAAGAERLGARDLVATLAELGKRRFLLHNVHEDAPIVFEPRWAMSYLAGPMTREQIKALTAGGAEDAPAGAVEGAARAAGAAAASSGSAAKLRPVLPPSIRQAFARSAPPGEAWAYAPRLLVAGNVAYTSAKPKVDESRPFVAVAPLSRDALQVDWSEGSIEDAALDGWQTEPVPGASFIEPPEGAVSERVLRAAESALERWLREHRPLRLLRSATLAATSLPGESERDFRIRLQQLANERRDEAAAKLKARYAAETGKLAERMRRSEQALQREQQQASGQHVDTMVSIGAALLGSLLGRKRVSVTAATRIGSAVRKVGRSREQSADVERANENVAALQERLADLEAQLEKDVDALDSSFDAQREPLEELAVKAKASGITIDFCGVGWVIAPLV